jgi:hypothetical protein
MRANANQSAPTEEFPSTEEEFFDMFPRAPSIAITPSQPGAVSTSGTEMKTAHTNDVGTSGQVAHSRSAQIQGQGTARPLPESHMSAGAEAAVGSVRQGNNAYRPTGVGSGHIHQDPYSNAQQSLATNRTYSDAIGGYPSDMMGAWPPPQPAGSLPNSFEEELAAIRGFHFLDESLGQ